MYAIQYRDRKGRTSVLSDRYESKRTADHKIMRMAEVWKEPPSMSYATCVIHNPGESTAYFNYGRDDYIQATRVWRE